MLLGDLIMAATAKILPKHRTQEERSASTRQALLLAARETICELGYSKTTVSEVSHRAGVSRGAQVHHYPSKEIMMLAVADFIFSGVERDLLRIADRLTKSPGDVEAFINDIWERVFCHDNFHPIMELVNAARTHPALRELLAVRWQSLIETYNDIWTKVLESSEHREPELEMLLNLTLSLLRGMAFQSVIDDAGPKYYNDMLKAWSLIVKGIIGKETLHGLKII
jgi:AcrR family transcriptional regulator